MVVSINNIDWTSINPREFEELCYHLLCSMEFFNVEWIGERGQDRGRDLRAQKTIELLPGKQEVTKWMVQCKRYTSNKLRKEDFIESLRWADGYNPDYYLLITSTNLDANTRDWLDLEKEHSSFQILLIEKPRLEELIRERVEVLRPYIPENMVKQFSIGKYVELKKTTTVEDLFGLRQRNDSNSLKSLISDKNVIPKGSSVDGPIYGYSIVIEQNCTINGSIYARRDIKIEEGTMVTGVIICPGSIELCDCKLKDVCGSQITLLRSCVIEGNLITDRDIHIPPDSKINNIFCSGSKIVIGKNSILDNIFCNGATELGENVRIKNTLHSSEITMSSGCIINQISLNGNLEIPEQVKISSLSTKGSVRIGQNTKVSMISTTGDVTLDRENKIEEVFCRNLFAEKNIEIKKLRTKGSVSILDKKGCYCGSIIISDGNIQLKDNSNVSVIISRGDIVLGDECSFKVLEAKNLKTGDNISCGDIRCSGTVELGNNCEVGSLQAIGDIKFQNNLKSKDWTIFSEKGKIEGREKIILGDQEIDLKDKIRFEDKTLLTTIININQLDLIKKLNK